MPGFFHWYKGSNSCPHACIASSLLMMTSLHPFHLFLREIVPVYVAQACLELEIPLPPPQKHGKYKPMLSHLVLQLSL